MDNNKETLDNAKFGSYKDLQLFEFDLKSFVFAIENREIYFVQICSSF